MTQRTALEPWAPALYLRARHREGRLPSPEVDKTECNPPDRPKDRYDPAWTQQLGKPTAPRH